MNDHYV